MAEKTYWFAPKVIGIGSGLPIAWQGWVVYAAFLLLCPMDLTFTPQPWRGVGLAALVVAVGAVCWAKTEGGWRWR